MERAIGEVFDFDGVRLRVERTNNTVCDGCYFEQGCWRINRIEEAGICHGDIRSDENHVIFVKVEDSENKEES